MTARRHVLVLGDQLNASAGALADREPGSTTVLLVVSTEWGRRRPYHRQKLVLVYAAIRHFAAELAEAGYDVHLRRVDRFADGVAAHLASFPGAELTVAEPADHGIADLVRGAVEAAGGTLRVVANDLWLSDAVDFDRWAADRPTLRMEGWYRRERERTGWLMADGEPVGGVWNLDAENRRVPPSGTSFPALPRFEPDEMTRDTIAWVDRTFPDNPGALEPFSWPVTRRDALRALEAFVDERLADFGPYEDALVDGERSLHHSLLSAALNLGLLTAREACEAALAAWADPDRAADPVRAVPLSSVEGFVRQLLGWREFIRHVYRRRMPGIRAANDLGHHGTLPAFYWSGETRMRCVGEAVRSVVETGHAHHIQRLMVLGNWALLAGVAPAEVNDWFLEMFVDAFDWVVTPNVIGMSQFADRSFTSKPYVAGGAYLRRMGDHCGRCAYRPDRSIGDDACPFSTLYWDFVDRHLDMIGGNHRTAPVAAAWRKRDEAARDAIRSRADEVRRLAAAGTL